MMNNSKFMELSNEEIMEVEGGIALGVTLCVTLFCAGFTGGIAVGISRKNRK